MVSSMDRFFEKYDNLNKLVYFALTFAGLMDKEGNKKWFPIYTCYHVSCLHIWTAATIMELAVGSREVRDVVGTLSTMVTAICAIFRAMRFFFRKKEITNILERLDILRLKMLKDEDNKHILIQTETIGRKILTVVFISLNGFPIASFFWFTFCDYLYDFKEQHVILKTWVPWNREEMWPNILTNLLLSVTCVPCLTIYVAIHCVEITFTLYVSAYIKTLQNNLINKGIRNKEIYEQHKVIIQLIKDHNKALSGVKYIETQISPLMPCGFGYVFIRAIKKNEISVAVDNYLRAVLCLFPAMISCFCGQNVISQMENLHHGTYMTNWYEESTRIRKTFLMMMIRTTNTPTINYRLFITFDHVLLSLVLQTVYSYIMLMVNLDTD